MRTVEITEVSESRRAAFWAKVDTSGDCWLWTGTRLPNGYGQYWISPHKVVAHRVSWVMHHGPIPEGLLIDHLCRVKACVRPDHLELVTNQVNTLRGERSYALNGMCRNRLHDMTLPGAIYTYPSGRRTCAACRRVWINAQNERYKAARR